MLTFEAIRDAERGERESKRLQRLPEEWLAELGAYLAAKSRAEEMNDSMEFRAVQATVQRLFELRERKLVEHAMITARTGIPPENLLKEEETLFWNTVQDLKKFREEFFGKLSRPEAEKKYRVLKGMPEFVGPDMASYSLKEGEVRPLPKELAELLIKQGAIEEVK